MELLRRIAERRQGRPAAAQALVAVVNCGFPETAHCRPAAEIVRIFAAQAGFRFLGCLATGMGGAVGNRDLAKPAAPAATRSRPWTRPPLIWRKARRSPLESSS